jgi:UDP-N-acetylglucosamine diphosphorylase / glucose-1-phosphate thymidylyltransferase / UDP-N-acetylgalactosamine diphosphorylase / glucosamine-1-phosphate N-acetyltransferase / galactosamine-1-phosphate N-acetyltransferase
VRVLILAGGEGTRLAPLTKYMPKVMVPIHGKPFLHYILTWLKKHDVVLSVCYQKDAIKCWCKENKHVVEYVEEPKLLGTAGSLAVAEPFFNNVRKFAVINGDTFIDEDLSLISAKHMQIATIVKARCMLDNELRNAGIYMFSRSIFDYLKHSNGTTIDDKLRLLNCSAYLSQKQYLDIGTHAGLKYAKESKLFRGQRWGTE